MGKCRENRPRSRHCDRQIAVSQATLPSRRGCVSFARENTVRNSPRPLAGLFYWRNLANSRQGRFVADSIPRFVPRALISFAQPSFPLRTAKWQRRRRHRRASAPPVTARRHRWIGSHSTRPTQSFANRFSGSEPDRNGLCPWRCKIASWATRTICDYPAGCPKETESGRRYQSESRTDRRAASGSGARNQRRQSTGNGSRSRHSRHSQLCHRRLTPSTKLFPPRRSLPMF